MNKVNIYLVASNLLDSDDEGSDEMFLWNLSVSKHLKKRLSVKNYVENVALRYDFDDFKNQFRLRRDTFENILGILGPRLYTSTTETNAGRPRESPEKQFLVALAMLSNQQCFRNISEKFDISKSTAWCYLHKICEILVTLSGEYIKWPIDAEAAKSISLFQERQGFPNVLGAMDCTHIPITPPSKQQSSYCNRNKYHSIILQAICNSKYIFIDVYAGYPGSVHDARVFRNSDIKQKLENNPALLPYDSHILADSAYVHSHMVLTPYKDNGHLTRAQKLYNFKHSSTRVFIEQSFGLLKGRFRILKHVNIYKTELIPPLIVACCVLHNMCMQRGDDDVELYFNDCDVMPSTYTGDASVSNKRNSITQLFWNAQQH